VELAVRVLFSSVGNLHPGTPTILRGCPAILQSDEDCLQHLIGFHSIIFCHDNPEPSPGAWVPSKIHKPNF
jgi:hypothetical protein